MPIFYGYNIFHILGSDCGVCPLLASANARSLALIRYVGLLVDRRIEVPLDRSNFSEIPPEERFSHALQELYAPPPRLPTLQPLSLNMANLQGFLGWSDICELYNEGHIVHYRVQPLMDELYHSALESTSGPGGRPLHEEVALKHRISEMLYQINAWKLRQGILAVVAEVQALEPALSHVYLARPEGFLCSDWRRPSGVNILLEGSSTLPLDEQVFRPSKPSCLESMTGFANTYTAVASKLTLNESTSRSQRSTTFHMSLRGSAAHMREFRENCH